MFGFFKLSSAPPNVYRYYRHTNDSNEKKVIEILNNKYNEVLKESEIVVRRAEINGANNFNNVEYRNALIQTMAFEELIEFANKENYPEFLVMLFR